MPGADSDRLCQTFMRHCVFGIVTYSRGLVGCLPGLPWPCLRGFGVWEGIEPSGRSQPDAPYPFSVGFLRTSDKSAKTLSGSPVWNRTALPSYASEWSVLWGFSIHRCQSPYLTLRGVCL